MKDGAITTHGNDDGRLTFIDLGAGEFVKRIEGRANDTSVVALTFVTNTRKSSALECHSLSLPL